SLQLLGWPRPSRSPLFPYTTLFRSIVAFAKNQGIISNSTRFLAVDGIHEASIDQAGTWVSLKMNDVNNIDSDGNDYILNTGSPRSEEHTSELQSRENLVCRLLLEKK